MMLQTMLAERFHLSAHHEKRELPAYVLSVAKGGLKMKAHPDARVSYRPSLDAAGTHLLGTITVPTLATVLTYVVGRPISDGTGITGVYDISLDYSTDEAKDSTAAPQIFTALEEQLGLKLESKKAPFDVIVVDRIDKIATDN